VGAAGRTSAAGSAERAKTREALDRTVEEAREALDGVERELQEAVDQDRTLADDAARLKPSRGRSPLPGHLSYGHAADHRSNLVPNCHPTERAATGNTSHLRR